jgi:hypothetical protein
MDANHFGWIFPALLLISPILFVIIGVTGEGIKRSDFRGPRGKCSDLQAARRPVDQGKCRKSH